MNNSTKIRLKNVMTPKQTHKPLKIGFVFDDSLDKPDGVQQYILSIGQWFASQGHDVHYLVGSTNRSDLRGVHSLSRNLNVKFNGNGMSIPLPTSRAMLRRFLATEAFDVLHVQVPYSPWLAGRLISASSPTTAIIGTFHIVAFSPLVTAASRFLGLYTASTISKFDEIVSVSSAAQAFARRTYHISTAIVPNAVDYQRFHEAQPLKKYEDDVVTILFLGRLVPRKGCLNLLGAVILLVQKNFVATKFRVVICGKGPQLENLEKLTRANGLDNIVEFVGFVSEADKPSYYASADIAVFPSTGGESFGIVLVEAMASGKACVLGGDNSGYSSVLETQPDLLFDRYSVEALAEKLRYYLDHADERKAMALWGATYAQQFDNAVVGQELLQRYHQALHKRRSTAIIKS